MSRSVFASSMATAFVAALLLATGPVAAQGVPTQPCERVLADAPSLAWRTGAPREYPPAAFDAGIEGTVGFQYRVVSPSGAVKVDCIYRSSGDPRLDTSAVAAVNASQYFLPKAWEWPRDAGRVYQDTIVYSWQRESTRRVPSQRASDRLLNEPKPVLPIGLGYSFKGSTALRAHVDGSGSVHMVSMLKSCGDSRLDAVALATLLAYKFKPGDPLTFDRTFEFIID